MPRFLWFVLFIGLCLFAKAAAVAADAAPKASPLGKTIDNFELADFRGKQFSLAELKERKAIVVAFVGVECPLVAHYASRLQELAAKYESNGVALIAIDSNQQDSLTELGAFARRHKLEIPVLKDPGNKVADAFSAQRTPEVFILDQDRRVVFHGRIDDQFTYSKQGPNIEHAYLTDALDQLLADQKIIAPHAEPVGCHIGRVLTPKSNSDVTYSKQIARIFQDRCVRCHRPGEIGPFALTSYDEVVGWAEMIREVVQEQRMPPWHANPEHGKFINEARLSDEEKDQIVRWVAAGAPEGNKADLPPPREYTVGWQIGQPDTVIYMSDKPYNVPAKGEIRYQYFRIDPGFKEDKWVQMAECRPGNRAVVHHIIVGIVPPGGRFGEQNNIGGVHSDWLTATAPGARPLILKEGMAKLIPAGSQLVFQMHYTPNGTAQEDRSSVGLVFADPKTVKRTVGTDKAAFQAFRIPPGANNHHVDAYHRFDRDMLMLAMFPHMHLRGKAFRYTAIYPDGKEEILLDVPRFDFAWQCSYELAEPKKMPQGTRLHCEAWFDNSEENLANPDPSATVRWGDQTWEEMMIGYFDATPIGEKSDVQGGIGPRTAAFAALAKDGPLKLNGDLQSAAASALDSDENLQRFAAELRKAVPQLDRLCWSTVEDTKLHIRRCAQDPELDKTIGGAGRKVDVRITKMAGYAEKSEPIVNQRLAQERGIDLQYMSRVYKSSAHFPVAIEGLKGSVNFWSTEQDAFPAEAVALLQQAAKAMAK